MKTTKTCPKCSSQDIIRIPGRVRSHGVGNGIPMVKNIFNFSYIMVTRYVCSRCGFSEEWIDSAADLTKLELKYG